MSRKDIPKWFETIRKMHPDFLSAVENLGKVLKKEGPLDDKTIHLIQLAAAATLRSEGSVHSHVRQAMEAGATSEEVTHAIIVLTSTIGFPNVSAALSWAEDVIREQ